MKLIIIITKPPHGDIKTREALRYAYTAAEIEVKVYLILVDGGVLLAKKGKSSGIARYDDLQKGVRDVMDLGGTIVVDKGSLRDFGLDSSDCLDDIQIRNGYDISELVKSANKTMIF